MKSKKQSLLSIGLTISLIVFANIVSNINCGVAFGFVSTNYTSGDKCVSCATQRLYYCNNTKSKVLDCYDSQDDCPAINPSTPDTVTWLVSPYKCTNKVLPKSPCGQTIIINDKLVGGSETFSVNLQRNEICGFFLINNLNTGTASWTLSESNTASVQFSAADAPPDFQASAGTYDYRTYAPIPTDKQELAAGSGVAFIAGNTIWNSKISDPALYTQTFEISFQMGVITQASLMFMIAVASLITFN
eukprot:403357684